MTALSQDRNTSQLVGTILSLGVAAATLIYSGSIVMRNATGYATKGATALGLTGVGIANHRVDNSAGAAGDENIDVALGVFKVANSAASDAITIADIGKPCYAVDDQTVAKTNGLTAGVPTRSAAGIIVGVEASGVHVLFNEAILRAVLAGHREFVQLRVTTLVGAGVYRVLSPVAGKVVNIGSVIEGVLTTGDATLTGKIDGVAITTGVITITQAASAAGDKDFAAPTAANTVAVGGELSLTVGGTNATATVANCFFEIERA
ncbi:hypothetical protein [Mesorhizobium sp.]|uniref:hypothetical protein n=1 Tax=Mesorhizobium sp. TaxID=1871066 RepID=UPI0025F28F0D|nr:hypothetical protein [Mesorhizobium sp.]